MRDAVWKILMVALGMVLLAGLAESPAAAEAQRMTIDELKAALGQPGVIVLDVRAEGDWQGSDQKIKGAVRVAPNDMKAWAGKYPKDKTIVLYCA